LYVHIHQSMVTLVKNCAASNIPRFSYIPLKMTLDLG
jgi:hypothetical protein